MAETTLIQIDAEADFTDAFTDEQLGTSAGLWRFDDGGSTVTSNTGPGSNNVSPFMHTETSATTTLATAEINGIATFADVPDGVSRVLNIRLCIQGNFGDGNEGMEIQQRASDSDTWAIAGDLISGWDFSNSYTVGNTITNENGDDLVCAETGGWIDFQIDIPDSATQVRLQPRYIDSEAQRFRHDIGFRSFFFEFFQGAGNQAPTADAGDDQSVAAGVEVTLDGSASSDQDGTIASYAWAQLLGDTVALSSASASQPTFDAPETNAAQTLRFRLTITDNDGATDTDTVDVDVAAISITPNVAPSADAGPNQTVAAGASVTLDGSGSFDSDGTIASYAWTQTAGDNVALSSTSAQFPTFTAPSEAAAQFLRFRLTTTDNDGATDTDNVRIDVQAAGPPPLVVARRKDAASIKPVWLVEIDADQLGQSPTTLRWASRDITLSADDYDGDVLAEADPVAIRFGNLRARGGQAFPGTATVRAANTERLQATLAASYDLENDPCRLYLYFDGTTGADDDNKILLFSGVIDDYESTEDLLTLSIVDDAFRLIRSFPTERLTPATYPFAPLDDYGEPVPLVLGRMAQAGPYDGSGDRFSLAPCRCVDKFTAEFLPASNIHTAGAVYQAYRSGQRQHVARIPTADIDEQAGNTFKVVGATRQLRRPPMRSETDNEVEDWQRVADWRDDTSVNMAANDLLSLYMGGSARLGTITGLTLYLDFTGTVSARTTIGGFEDIAATTLTTPTAGAIRTAALSVSEWADSWGFERINVRITSSGTSTIRRVWIEAEFDHDGIDDIEQWAISRAISGLADTDVLASGAVLENPADVIEGVLRHISIPSSRINASSAAAAKIARDDWRYGASIDRVRRPDFVSEMCAQAGYDLFTDNQGRLTLSAQGVGGDPVGVFLQDRHLIFDEQRQGHDIRINATPMGDLLNEGVVQYAFDPIANRFAGIAVQSGAYRTMQESANGEVAAKSGGGFEFTDSTVASFLSRGAQVNDFLWTSGGSGQLLRVTSVAAAALGVAAARGVGVITEDGIDSWYLGPNLNAAVLRSQLRYKLTRDYGGERGDFTDSAGYQASMIADDFTADALADHLVRWHADRLYQVQIETDWSGCDLQLGDVVVFDSDWLPAAKRPRLIDATVSCTFTAGEVTFSTSASLAALLYPETDHGDLMLIGDEVCRLTGVSSGSYTAVRAAVGAAIYPVGTRTLAIKRIEHLWRIMAAEVSTRDRMLVWRWRLFEVPGGRPRFFRLWKDNSPPAYADATDDERLIYGTTSNQDGVQDNFDFESYSPVLGY